MVEAREHVAVVQFSAEDVSRTEIEDDTHGILNDDPIAHVGSKLRRVANGRPVCWWVETEANAVAVAEARDASPDSEPTWVLSSDSRMWICPYMRGVYNAAIQLRDAPDTLKNATKTAAKGLDRLDEWRSISFVVLPPELERLSSPVAPDADLLWSRVVPASPHKHSFSTVEYETRYLAPRGLADVYWRSSVRNDAVLAGAMIGRDGLRDQYVHPGAERSDPSFHAKLAKCLKRSRAEDVNVTLLFASGLGVQLKDDDTATAFYDDLAVDAVPGIGADDLDALSTLGVYVRPSDPVVTRVRAGVVLPESVNVPERDLVSNLRTSYGSSVHATLTDSGRDVWCTYRRTNDTSAPKSNAYSKVRSGAWSREKLVHHLTEVMRASDAAVEDAIAHAKVLDAPKTYAWCSVRKSGRVLDVEASSVDLCARLTDIVVACAEGDVAETRPGSLDIDDILRGSETTRVRARTTPDLLTSLQASDAALFDPGRGRRYSRMCGKVDQRQPTAITADEAASMGLEPSEFVQPVSSNTVYICPDAWCVGDRIAMSRQSAEKADWTCPNGEPVVDMMTAKYWKNANRRHVGFLDPSSHQSGLCMPCCYKKPMKPEKNPQCSAGGPAAPAWGARGDYVLSEDTIPLPVGRTGLVPGSVAGVGAVRTGIPQDRHRWASVVAATSGLTAENVVAEVVSSMTPTGVSAACTPEVYAAISREDPLDAEHPETIDAFVEYANSEVGSARFAQVGVKVPSNAGAVTVDDPTILREMIVWHVYAFFLRAMEEGSTWHENIHALCLSQFSGYVPTTVGPSRRFRVWPRPPTRLPRSISFAYEDGDSLEPISGVEERIRVAVDGAAFREDDAEKVRLAMRENGMEITAAAVGRDHCIHGFVTGGVLVKLTRPSCDHDGGSLQYDIVAASEGEDEATAEVRDRLKASGAIASVADVVRVVAAPPAVGGDAIVLRRIDLSTERERDDCARNAFRDDPDGFTLATHPLTPWSWDERRRWFEANVGIGSLEDVTMPAYSTPTFAVDESYKALFPLAISAYKHDPLRFKNYVDDSDLEYYPTGITRTEHVVAAQLSAHGADALELSSAGAISVSPNSVHAFDVGTLGITDPITTIASQGKKLNLHSSGTVAIHAPTAKIFGADTFAITPTSGGTGTSRLVASSGQVSIGTTDAEGVVQSECLMTDTAFSLKSGASGISSEDEPTAAIRFDGLSHEFFAGTDALERAGGTGAISITEHKVVIRNNVDISGAFNSVTDRNTHLQVEDQTISLCHAADPVVQGRDQSLIGDVGMSIDSIPNDAQTLLEYVDAGGEPIFVESGGAVNSDLVKTSGLFEKGVLYALGDGMRAAGVTSELSRLTEPYWNISGGSLQLSTHVPEQPGGVLKHALTFRLTDDGHVELVKTSNILSWNDALGAYTASSEGSVSVHTRWV